ncbi:hypothetical protein B6I21_02335 [candidate division KSB1 bacterium 4572_119]|nr:MAG: hypothetical protein B6I21_02335 [candidate division KSB1 bacterium 4572_119]
MKHPRTRVWESKLSEMINDLDDLLEDKFGKRYRLHPVRPERGKTSSKIHDGLFSVVANFSLGAGSEYGKGYVVDVHFATLDKIDKKDVDAVEKETIAFLKKKIPVFFPGKKLHVGRDNNVIKIHGDLSLGEV